MLNVCEKNDFMFVTNVCIMLYMNVCKKKSMYVTYEKKYFIYVANGCMMLYACEKNISFLSHIGA